jgi:hypothetical protein
VSSASGGAVPAAEAEAQATVVEEGGVSAGHAKEGRVAGPRVEARDQQRPTPEGNMNSDRKGRRRGAVSIVKGWWEH